MVFPLTKLNKEGTLLNASHSYYSEEYAQRICDGSWHRMLFTVKKGMSLEM